MNADLPDILGSPGDPPDVEIAFLTSRLRETQRRLIELKGGKWALDELSGSSEQQFASAFANAAVGMTVGALDGRYLKVNRALCQMLGYEEAELLGKTYQELTFPEDLEADAVQMQALLAGEVASFQLEKRYIHQKGHLVWVLLSVSLFRNEAGQPVHLISQIQEITDRKKNEYARELAEQVARESVQRLEFVLVSADIGEWNLDLRTNVAHRSLRHDQCFGYPERVPTWSYETFLAHIQPMDRERVDACFKEAMALQGDYDEEFRVVWPDGSEHWLWAKGRFYFGEEGQPERVAGILMDITERKRIEHALLESEARSRAIVESSLDGIITMDHEGLTTEFNPAAEQMFGYSQAEAMGREMADLIIPKRLRSAHRAGLARYLTTAASEILGKRIELPGLRADGTEFPLELTVTRMGRVEPPRFTGFLRDIGERKRAESALKEALERLTEAQRIGKIGDWDWDVTTDAITWSPEVFEIFGRDPLLGPPKSFEEHRQILEPASFVLTQEKMVQAISTGEAIEYEIVVIRPDGRRVDVHAMAVPRKDEGGRVKTIYGTIQDISARKQDEQMLLESEMRFRTLLQGVSSVAVQSYRMDGTVRYWNKASEKFYGYTSEEAIGRNMLDLIIPREMRNEVKLAFRQMADTGEPIPSAEITLMRKDTSPITVFSSHASVKIPGRETELFCIDIDLTERKHAEWETSRMNRALKMLSACNEAVIRVKDEPDLLARICQIAVEYGGYRMAWVGYAQNDAGRSIIPIAFAGAEEGYLSTIDVSWDVTKASGQGPAGQSIRTGQAVLVADLVEDGKFKPWLEQALSRGYRGIICLPLVSDGHALGLLGLYFADVVETTAEEMKLLQEMADDLAFGILTLRIRIEREQTHEAVLKMARGVSSTTGEEFFKLLTLSMVDALSAQAGFIARLTSPDPTRIRTICAVVGGETIPNFEYDLAGTPCEDLDRSDIWVIPREAQRLFPQSLSMAAMEVESLVATKLTAASGRSLGLMFVHFKQPLENEEFTASTLKIFAARAVAELERQEFDARTREQAALLDKAQDAILVRDLDHRITYWNRSAERLYGWTAEEARGQVSYELLKVDAAQFSEADRIVHKSGEWTGEMVKTTRTGAKLTLDSRWTLVRGADGHPASILIIDTDITEKKKIEQQFLRSQRMESIGTLAGGIAHDLNNSLTPIIMSLELLQMKFRDEESQKLLTIINSSAKRGADMVQQVLSFARGVEGRKIEVQVRHLLQDIEKIINETFLKNIQVGASISKEIWPVLGDPTQLHQVLLNLCVNARDAMPNGGMLTLSAQNIWLDAQYAGLNSDARPGPYVFIQVEDTGTGMPPEVIEKIFDPFFTTKEIGKGTGLGLSTSLAIVKSHGGFLRVYSEAGKGTRFKVHLPAQTGEAAEHGEIAVELPRGNGELILVVDDEISVRQIIQQTLEAFGYRVLLASDGSEAIAIYAARAAEISVVLTDMMMPSLDGPATILVLRRLNPAVRIIGASGLSATGFVVKAAPHGVNHFLPKPYTAETMLKVIKETLSEN